MLTVFNCHSTTPHIELLLDLMHVIFSLFIIPVSRPFSASLPIHTTPHFLIKPPVLSDTSVIGGNSGDRDDTVNMSNLYRTTDTIRRHFLTFFVSNI